MYLGKCGIFDIVSMVFCAVKFQMRNLLSCFFIVCMRVVTQRFFTWLNKICHMPNVLFKLSINVVLL